MIAKRIPYHKDKMIFCLSYLHNGIFYTNKVRQHIHFDNGHRSISLLPYYHYIHIMPLQSINILFYHSIQYTIEWQILDPQPGDNFTGNF